MKLKCNKAPFAAKTLGLERGHSCPPVAGRVLRIPRGGLRVLSVTTENSLIGKTEGGQECPRSHAQERGVALVVTLILLAVITFMAITFLVVSRSERGSVSTTTDQALARLAADAALEHAKADLLMPIMAQNNPFLVGMIVSTNYINRYGFTPGLVSPTNVNFDYKGPDGAGGALSLAEQRENLANLLYRPRVPVFMRDRATGNDVFQYYLDFNRNGRHEPTGWLVVTNTLNEPVLDNDGNPVFANFTGDPEWIGGLEFPNERHSGDNRFIYRFAYVVAPVGQTLDLNAMHNATRLSLPPTMPGDEFVRNQGVGTWEMNLGAFLTDLNTNMWFSSNPDEGGYAGWGSGYLYDAANLAGFNRGAGFDDATALLRYRYGGTRETLWTPIGLLGAAGAAALNRDNYDAFGNGDGLALQNSADGYVLDPDASQNRTTRPWSGSYNTNLFYSPYDLYDDSKTRVGLAPGVKSVTDRLREAATRPSSYDRYTFQRLLEQLGTESAPEDNKINVNYQNVVNGRVIPNLQTNFTPWNALEFFSNAADRLLDNAGFTFTVTNIQVWPTNHYTPSVHRALQLAANLHDATTNRTTPTVFRPLFERRTVNGYPGIYIRGYQEVANVAQMGGLTWHDPLQSTNAVIQGNDMLYGVPLVIGAKKNLPNFNEFGMDTKMVITRKLEFKRRNGNNNGEINQTNQMITVAMINNLGLEAWNSYRKRLTGFGNVSVYGRVEVFCSMTNSTGQLIFPTAGFNGIIGVSNAPAPTFADGQWEGWSSATTTITDNSLVNVVTNFTVLLPSSTFRDNSQRFIPLTADFEDNNSFPIQDWKLNIRLRVQFNITGQDIVTGQTRFLDFVNLTDFKTFDIASLLQMENQEDVAGCGLPYRPYSPSAAPGSMWCTNREGGTFVLTAPTYGVLNQIDVSAGNTDSTIWRKQTNIAGINFFRHQFGWGLLAGTSGEYSLTNTFYAPYSPTRELYLVTKWQANDPLVHYTTGDLFDQGRPYTWSFTTNDSAMQNIRKLNGRYEPYVLGTDSSSATAYELSLKDPLVFGSDAWDFPTNKLPNIGWIGRVHRGTPWQTVYLKSKMAETNLWNKWAGSHVGYTNLGQVKFSLVASNDVVRDSLFSMPFQDWALLDMFSASLVDNATRGQLSINQPGLAAWSAVLSGVPVLTNLTLNSFTNIQPAAVDPALRVIVDGINRTRGERPGGVFKHLGEICSVPELTVASPYIQNTGPLGDRDFDTVSDAVYERIPQQVLGLLRCESTPRFVVYSYGQALKPATGSLVTSGTYSQMATNYQVTAEVATRAVVRVDGAPENPQVVIENFNVLPPD